MFPSMPENAIRHVKVDHVVPIAELAPLLVRLTATPIEQRDRIEVPPHLDVEVRIARDDDPIKAGVHQMGEPSRFARPEGHGLLQMMEAGPIRFRCHIGHAFSIESLVAEVGEAIEVALWNAIRSIQEGAMLLKDRGQHAR